jgi:hypothetical protein
VNKGIAKLLLIGAGAVACEAAPAADLAVRSNDAAVDSGEDGGAFPELAAPSDGGRVDIGRDVADASVMEFVSCEPSELAFGLVPLGERAIRSIACEQFSETTVTLTRPRIEGPDDGFSVEPSEPVTLAPLSSTGEPEVALFSVVYAARQADRARGTWVVDVLPAGRRFPIPQRVELTAGTRERVCLNIEPAEIEFGLTALAVPSRRELLLSNTCSEDVRISSITFEDASFSSPDANADVISPGATTLLDIEFSPAIEGPVQSVLRIASNARSGDREVVLRGEGIRSPACQVSLRPESRLDFGRASPGSRVTSTVVLRNLSLVDSCLLNRAGLSRASDPEFRAGSRGSTRVGPNSTVTIPVVFAPENLGTFRGVFEVALTDPADPIRVIELVGVGAD